MQILFHQFDFFVRGDGGEKLCQLDDAPFNFPATKCVFWGGLRSVMVIITLLTLEQEVRGWNPGATPPKSLEPIPLPCSECPEPGIAKKIFVFCFFNFPLAFLQRCHMHMMRRPNAIGKPLLTSMLGAGKKGDIV